MSLEGTCSCGAVRYRLSGAPFVVHACHCRDCQRLTGSAFVINLWMEREHVQLEAGALKSLRLEAPSGKAHEVFFCDACATQLWSKYYATPGDTLMLRAGTLTEPSAVKPNVHIFTRSKLPWLTLPSDVPAFEAFYKLSDVWPRETLDRLRAHITAHAAQAG